MDGERTARIWRTLQQLRAQVEASLPYKQRRPSVIQFHRTITNVISDFEPLAITMPPRPKPRQPQPPESGAAAS